jgi:hypothetical protein
METTFAQIEIGGRFIFHGIEYTKMALGMAENSQRIGHVFQYQAIVQPIPDKEKTAPQ